MQVFINLWLALLPCITFGGAFEGPKVVWLWLFGACVSIYLVWALRNGMKISVSISLRIFALWICVLCITSIVGVHPVDSIVGGSYRHQGVLFFYALFLMAALLENRKRLRMLIHPMSLMLPSMVMVGIVFQQSFMQHIDRPIGLLGEPNAVALYFVFAIFWKVQSPIFGPFLSIFIGFIFSFCVYLVQSRSGFSSLLFILSALGVHRVLVSTQLTRVLRVVIVLLIIALMGITITYVSQEISNNRPQSPYENRYEFWRVGMEMSSKRPVLGYGAESLEFLYDSQYGVQSDLMIDRSHNIFLDVLLWSGYIGLSLFILWIMSAARSLYAGRAILKLCMLGAWIFFASVQPVGVVHWVYLILLIYYV